MPGTQEMACRCSPSSANSVQPRSRAPRRERPLWACRSTCSSHAPSLIPLSGRAVCLVAQLCPTLCNPMDCSLPDSSVHGGSPGKNTGVGCHALCQGIFPTQGSNPSLLHCRRILYPQRHQGSPNLFIVGQREREKECVCVCV